LLTAFTVLCASAEGLPDVSGGALEVDQCARIVAGGTTDLPAPEDVTAPEWARNYYGAFTAHPLRPDDPASPVLLFTHGENKNEDVGGIRYANTINTDATDYSGYDADGTYVDAWDSYNAFVGSVLLQNPRSVFTDGPGVTDNGPVVWPSAGYLDASGAKTSEGVRHPSTIVYNGFVYLFYLDESYGDDPDRHAGIKVARAPLDKAGAPGSFAAFYAGGFSEPALPTGYRASNLHGALGQPGPRTTAIRARQRKRRALQRRPGRSVPLRRTPLHRCRGVRRRRQRQRLVGRAASLDQPRRLVGAGADSRSRRRGLGGRLAQLPGVPGSERRHQQYRLARWLLPRRHPRLADQPRARRDRSGSERLTRRL